MGWVRSIDASSVMMGFVYRVVIDVCCADMLIRERRTA